MGNCSSSKPNENNLSNSPFIVDGQQVRRGEWLKGNSSDGKNEYDEATYGNGFYYARIPLTSENSFIVVQVPKSNLLDINCSSMATFQSKGGNVDLVRGILEEFNRLQQLTGYPGSINDNYDFSSKLIAYERECKAYLKQNEGRLNQNGITIVIPKHFPTWVEIRFRRTSNKNIRK